VSYQVSQAVLQFQMFVSTAIVVFSLLFCILRFVHTYFHSTTTSSTIALLIFGNLQLPDKTTWNYLIPSKWGSITLWL